jgi:hypothetical protein
MQQTLEQVIMVKEHDPIPKDVVKAAENVSGKGITYNQGFHPITMAKTINNEVDNDSYQLIVPYLHQFQEKNPGAEVHYQLVDGKIESLFICPSFMNASLWYIRPVMSLDTTHLSSQSKGTMYIAMVKTGQNQIYTVAFSIERTNECFDG